MSTKDMVIIFLEKNRERVVSGQELADILNISRAAIWKIIKTLKNEGHKIIASTNKGYMLQSDSDVLSEQGIRAYLDDKLSKEIDIIVKNSIDSTNNEAKRILMNSIPNKTTIILSNEQTAGRGRLGREFFSPPDTGIYMSIALKSNFFSDDVLTITLATAVAICNTIEFFNNNKAEIKWVNDIYVNGKKVSGILTEGFTDFESGMVDTIVVGIGLNVTTKEFGESLNTIAGSILLDKEHKTTRNHIAAKMIVQFFNLLSMIKDDKKVLIEQYKERSFIIGKEISYISGDMTSLGTAVDINDFGNLIVKNKDNILVTLKSGEVQILV